MAARQLEDIDDIAAVIADSPWHMDVLRTVRKLNLKDWMIGAGFVRNMVWDRLHGYDFRTPLSDVDVIYFDPNFSEPSYDQDYELQLSAILSGVPWSVRNQARMHVRNDDQPYLSSEDAMAHWLETPTCVGVKLRDDGGLSVIAPYGVRELLNLEVRPPPSGFKKPETYRDRIDKKDWLKPWPKLRILYAD
jgi:hypothetical protein